MATQVTHNNDGHFYTIDVDLAKEGAEVFDLTTYFKARVADNNVGLRFRWFWQGQVFNTVGKKPRVVGLVGQYSFKKADDGTNRELVMSPDASAVAFTGDVNDCEPGGYATYYFPQQMFPQDGMFKGTIGLLDDSGKTARYTSVDIWFKVYPNAGGAQMGKACDYYIDELDKAIKEAEEDLKVGQKAQQQIVDEYQQKITDLVSQLNTQGQTANSLMETVKAGLTTLEAKIQQDGLFTQAEADTFKQTITEQLNGFIDTAKKMLTTADQHLNYHAMSVSLSPTMSVDTNELNHLKYMQAQIAVCDMVNIQSATDDNPQLGDKQRLTQFLDEFKSAGLDVVMLKPHLGVNWDDSFNRGNYDPTDYNAFFGNWEKVLQYYAGICDQYKIPILCIGCEQAKTTQSQYSGSWKLIISNLKAKYPNLLLTYALTSTEASRDNGDWLGGLDYIGINVYPSYVSKIDDGSISKSDVVKGFYSDRSGLNYGKLLEKLHHKYHKPIYITEVGVMPQDDGLIVSLSEKAGQKPYDLNVSALAVDAAINGWMQDLPFIIGFNWWHLRGPYNIWDISTTDNSKAQDIWLNKFGGES